MFNNKLLTLASWFIFILGFLIPGVFIATLPGWPSGNFWLSYCIVLWSIMRLTYTGLQGTRRLTLMLFYVFVYVFLGVQPLLSAWCNNYPHKELSLPYGLYTYTAFLVILGIIAFEIGYAKLKPVEKNKQPDSPAPEQQVRVKAGYSHISTSKLWIGICVVTGMFIMSVLYYGLNTYLSLRDGFQFSESGGGAELSSVAERQLMIDGLRTLVAIMLFIALYARKVKKLTSLKTGSLKWAVLFLIFLNIVVSNPLNAPRLWSGSVLLTALFISNKWKPRSFLVWASAACLVLLLLFSGMDPRKVVSQTLLRGDQITLASTAQSVVEGIASLPYDANFDAFQIISYTTVYTDRYGYSLGKQLLLPMFFWIPRSIWTSKPIGTSDIVGANAGFYSVNVSSPLWTEGYVNFGVIGLILIMFVFGRAARISDAYLRQEYVRPIYPTIVSCYFAANTFILLRGDLTSGTMYLQMIMGFSFIILILVRKIKRPLASIQTAKP